jgi:uncharacterized protein YceK
MKKLILPLFIILLITLTGCSSVRKSISFGVVTGAVSGMVLANGNTQKAQTGLAIGALVGGITSYFIHEGLEKRDASIRKKTLFNLDKFGVFGQVKASSRTNSAPYSLSPAMVEQDYIETHVEDNGRLIEGHRIWTISQDSQWMPKKTNSNSKE